MLPCTSFIKPYYTSDLSVCKLYLLFVDLLLKNLLKTVYPEYITVELLFIVGFSLRLQILVSDY